MPAFSSNQQYAIGRSIDLLKSRMLHIHGQLTLSHDEYLALYATPEEIRILKQAAEIAEISGSSGCAFAEIAHDTFKEMTGDKRIELYFAITTVNGQAPLRPRNKVILPHADPAVVDKIVEWATNRLTVGLQFAKVSLLFSWLNINCTKDQLRFVWPSIIPLLVLDESTKDLAEKLREAKAPPKQLPRISAEVRRFCQETSGTIASAGLLDNPPGYAGAPVTVTLYKAQSQKTELGWISAL